MIYDIDGGEMADCYLSNWGCYDPEPIKEDQWAFFQRKYISVYAGQDLYPTFEEKAAHLLYFVTKNHSFWNGNNVFVFLR